MSKLDRIIKNEFCIGCGLCETLGKNFGYKMELKSNGFYYPCFPQKRNKSIEKQMVRICPGIHLKAPKTNNVWGVITETIFAYSNDSEIRRLGSSGGVVSATAIHLLESKSVDAILHVGAQNKSYLYNCLTISKTREEILNKAASRYAPAKMFDELIEIFEKNNDTYCFIGKPCDVQGLKFFLEINPKYQERIKFFIAIFCAGIPSYKATEQLLQRIKPDQIPISLRYRGDGWPGFFKATYSDKTSISLTYKESWGRYLGRKAHFRCKICPDGIGLASDLAVGDAWETNDGYPNFDEKEGRSFVLIRNKKMQEVIHTMYEQKKINIKQLNINDIQNMQPYQYARRLSAPLKVGVVSVLSLFYFDFKDVLPLFLLKKLSLTKIIKTIIGTFTRSFHRNKY